MILEVGDQLTLSSAGAGMSRDTLDLDFVACWSEQECSKRGRQLGEVDAAGAVALLDGPAPPATWRQLTWLSIFNKLTDPAHVVISIDTEDSESIDVVWFDLPGEYTLLFDGGQWRVFDDQLSPIYKQET